MQEGDVVFVYLSESDCREIKLQHGSSFDCKFGHFPHSSSFIGKPFGTKILALNGRGFVYCLRFSSNLYSSSAILHRTQIVFPTDISLVTQLLELRPGSIVIESGTGSGSMSSAIASAIAPTGKLHTYEFHQERARMATSDFEMHGFSHIITVRHRDAIHQGFRDDDSDDDPSMPSLGSVDAVFLDLPAPWQCIENGHVDGLMKPNGMFCSFSPCIEQVQRTSSALRKTRKFMDIRTVECLVRPFYVMWNDKSLLPPFQIPTISPDSGISTSSASSSSNTNHELATEKANDDQEPEISDEKHEEFEGDEPGEKRKRTGVDQPKAPESKKSRTTESKPMQPMQPKQHQQFEYRPSLLPQQPEMRGHTAFLTFARKAAI